jgi:hypothetical protein
MACPTNRFIKFENAVPRVQLLVEAGKTAAYCPDAEEEFRYVSSSADMLRRDGVR